jgi:hypothetical protein
MVNRITAVVVACSLISIMLCQQSAFAGSGPDKQALLAQKVKAGIVKLGIGRSSKVAIKLRDKSKLAGYVSEIGESSFIVTDIEGIKATAIGYRDVVQVKGNNLSTGAKVAIGVAIAIGVIITLYLVRGAFCDGC